MPLFGPGVGDGSQAAEAGLDGSPMVVLRGRAISLDRAAIAELLRLPKTAERRISSNEGKFLLNLFPDTAIPFQLEEVRPTDDGIGIQWIGSVDDGSGGSGSGSSIITWYQGAIAGFVRLANGEYYRVLIPAFGAGEVRQLKFLGYPAGRVDYIAQSGVGNGDNLRREVPTASRAEFDPAKLSESWSPDFPRNAGSFVVIDVLMAFASNTSGSIESYRNAVANNIIGEANLVYQHSNVAIQLRLVHTVSVNWSDLVPYSGASYDAALNALKIPNDGELDEIHQLRDQYGADVVSLIVAPPTSGGWIVVGVAYLMRNNPEGFAGSAFSVVHKDFAGGPSYTFAHELGHNFGLVHDEDNGGAGGGFHPYSKGYQQKVFTPKFFTVMAYSLGCDGCDAIPNFSNPNVNYSSIPTGVPDQIDAARTLEYTKNFAANWRPTAPPPPCTYQVSASVLNMNSPAADYPLQVRARTGCGWTAKVNVPWASFLNPASGNGDGVATLRLSENQTLDKRVGDVTIGGLTIPLTQWPRPCNASITQNRVSIGNASTVLDVNVRLGNPCRFQVESKTDWITPPDGPTQSGSQIVTVRLAVAANNNGSARTGRATIAGAPFDVLQNALPRVCSYNLPVTSLQVPAVSGHHTVGVTADPGCPWYATQTGGEPIFSYMGSGGVGTSTFSFMTHSNQSTASRTAVVNVEGNLLTVTQVGRPTGCAYSFDPKSFDIPVKGGTFVVRITATEGCYTSLNYPADWVRALTPTWGEGNLTVSFEVKPNNSAFARTGALSVGGSTARITQAGVPTPPDCYYTVTPNAIEFPSGDFTRQIKLETQIACPWALETNQAWLSSPTTAGFGPATLYLRAQANASLLQRTGTVIIGGQVISVTQSPMSSVQLLWPTPQVIVLHSRKDTPVSPKMEVTVAAADAVLPVKLTPPEVPWLKATMPATTTLAPFEVTADPAGLSAGVHEAILTVTNPGGAVAPARIPVLFQVRSASTVRVTPQSLSFRTRRGGVPPAQTLRLQRLAIAPEVVVSTQGGEWLRATLEEEDRGWRIDVETTTSALPVGIYDGAVTIRCTSGCASAVVPVRVAVENPVLAGDGPGLPRIASGGIVNAASFEQGIASGAWMSVFGSGLAETSRLWSDADFDGDLFPLQLDGVRVTVSGQPAPVNYISPGQINFQAPSNLPIGWVLVEVETPGGKDSAYVYSAAEAPGIFMFDNQRQVAALHPDGVPARKVMEPGAEGRTARPGDVLAVYATGFGPTNPEVPAGKIFSGAAPLADKDSVQVFVGGAEAEVQFIGLSASGLNQLNMVVPQLAPGSLELVVVIGGVPVQPGLVLEVEP